MINLKDQDDRPTSMVMIGSVVVMVCAGLFIAFAPKPTPNQTPDQVRKAKTRTNIAIKDSLKKIDVAKVVIANQTWPGTAEEVLPLALQKVTSMAQAHHLKIVGFHPQNVIVAPNISLIPCVVNVDGPFVNVVAFQKDIEAPGTNLVVNLMQYATADQESNKITASIGIIAYQPVKDVPVATTPSKTGTTPAKPAGGVKKSA